MSRLILKLFPVLRGQRDPLPDSDEVDSHSKPRLTPVADNKQWQGSSARYREIAGNFFQFDRPERDNGEGEAIEPADTLRKRFMTPLERSSNKLGWPHSRRARN